MCYTYKTCRNLNLNELIIQCSCFTEFISHVSGCISRINDLYARAIAHKDRIHFEVDDHINLENTTAVIWVATLQLLRGMNRLCQNVLALFAICPELDASRGVIYVFAHSYHVIKEVLRIKVWILAERFITRFYTNYTVKRKII